MKKMIAILLTMAMTLCAGAALAQENEVTANGVVQADESWKVTAPFAGVLGDYSWKAGSAVSEEDVLFTLDTVKVYAAESGTVGMVFAEAGDDADAVMRRYGALASIEPEKRLRVSASTAGCYDDKENRFVHAGEKVYFKNTEDKVIDGEGTVIYAEGSAYVVEVTKGNYELGQKVKLYRDENYTTKECIGTGAVSRADDALVQGTGRVLKVCVQAGDRVEKGQLLFELATGGAEPQVRSGEVKAGRSGIVTTAQAAPGQQAYKGMVLCQIVDPSSLRVVAEVDEVDLGTLAVGDAVSLTFDRYGDERFTGVVTMISAQGTVKQNATYYDVRIRVDTGKELLLGMNATVTLPASK